MIFKKWEALNEKRQIVFCYW